MNIQKVFKYKSLVSRLGFWGLGFLRSVMKTESQQMATLYSCFSRRQPHQRGRETSDPA